MKRTDADGNISNLFTDGDPTMGVPATVVDDTWLNQVQEEVCNTIEAAGIVLDDASDTQLLAAIQSLVQTGVIATNFTLANNQAAAADVTGLLFNKVTVRCVTIPFHIHRQTATPLEYDVMGKIRLWHKPVADTWNIDVSIESGDADDIGVEFSVTSAGQLKYTSSNLSGGSYAGQLRIAGVQKISV